MNNLTTITDNEIEMGFINSELIEEENRIRNLNDDDPEIIALYSELVDLIF